jgi:hypothetical protein
MLNKGTQYTEDYVAKSIVARALKTEIRAKTIICSNVGTAIKKIDTALPGSHTKALYHSLQRAEAKILAQL